jgi:selT/selW/selH-like putative selenoprotein
LHVLKLRTEALRARDRIVAKADAKVELVKGSGGVFEITVDGRLAFSKKQTGRFPTDQELDALVAA